MVAIVIDQPAPQRRKHAPRERRRRSRFGRRFSFRATCGSVGDPRGNLGSRRGNFGLRHGIDCERVPVFDQRIGCFVEPGAGRGSQRGHSPRSSRWRPCFSIRRYNVVRSMFA